MRNLQNKMPATATASQRAKGNLTMQKLPNKIGIEQARQNFHPSGIHPLGYEETAARVRQAYYGKRHWIIFLCPGPQALAFAFSLAGRYDSAPLGAFGLVIDRRLASIGVGCLLVAEKSYCSRAQIAALIRQHAPSFQMPDEQQDILMNGTPAQMQACAWWLDAQLHPGKREAKARAAARN